jgi:hypothetical protein
VVAFVDSKAVNVMESPWLEGSSLEETVVELDSLLTVCVSADEVLPLKFVLPP